MDRIDAVELRKVTRKVVQNASRPGGAMDKGEFTLGTARKEVSIRMGLGPKGLEEAECKATVKQLVHSAMDEVAEEVSAQGSSPVKPQRGLSPPTEKRATGTKTATRSRSEKRSKREPTNDEESDDLVVVEDEEEEEEEEGEEVDDAASPPRKRRGSNRHQDSRMMPTARRKGRREVGEGSVTSEEEEQPKRKSSASKRKDSGPRGPKRTSPTEVSDSTEAERQDDDKSESEMSSLYDVAPAPQRSKGTGKPRGPSEDATGTKKLSAEEAHVAELKKIVTACGMRKIWSKEFADDPTPKEQLHRIEVILRELGMKGKPTVGKARTLREKRELAAELNDVQEFEAARGLSSTRSSRSKAKAKTAVQRDSGSSNVEDDQASDASQGAFGAIMDFLGEDAGSESD